MRSWLFLTIVSLFLCAPAIASEQGKYRPGHTYLRAPAQHPDICANQCAGDALCKSWNFVTVNKASGAVCEFNARLETPVSHPMSISGVNPTAWDSSKIIPAGYRTTRVGQSIIQPRSRRQNTIRVGQVPSQHNIKGQSRIVPAPISRQIRRPDPAAAPSPTRMPAPAPSPKLNASPQHMRAGSSFTAPSSYELPSPHNSPALALRAPRPNTPAQARPLMEQRIIPHLDVINEPDINQALAIPMPQVHSPQSAAPHSAKARTGLTPLSQLPDIPMRRPITESGLAGAPAPARQSLYGSLHDDVKIPRILTPADIPNDPDAPIPTVRSVPVVQIDQGNL